MKAAAKAGCESAPAAFGPSPRLDEGLQVARRYPDRVQHAHVGELALGYQSVHGCRAHAQLGRHVAHGEEGLAPAAYHAQGPRPLQQGCSKFTAKPS
jgi:hypothetical protein